MTKNLKTALIEAQDLSRPRKWELSRSEFSNRASSLTPTSQAFIEGVGGWNHVDNTRTQPYHEMQVFDASNDASLQFDWAAEARRYNAPLRIVATMVENANLVRALLKRISELGADSSLLAQSTVDSISHGENDPSGLNLSNWPTLTLKNLSTSKTSKIAARLLIGADGINSPVRTFASINSHGWDYNRHGVVATLQADDSIEPSPHAVAFQRFLPSLGGPIALLPLPYPHFSLVWSTTPKNAAYLKSLPPTSTLALINAAFRLREPDLAFMFTLPPNQPDDPDTNAHESELLFRLPHTASPLSPEKMPPIITNVQENSIASFPLRFRHATTLTAQRVALAGDAAHTIHPLAGQGLNLGLADARALFETIAYAVEHGQDLGDPMTLERYNSERFGKGLGMAGVVDGLERLYGFGGTSDGVGGLMSRLAGGVRGVGMSVLGGPWGGMVRERIMRGVE